MSRAVLVLGAIVFVFSGIDAAKYSLVTGPDIRWHKSADGSLFYIETEEKFNWHDAWNECARKNMSLIATDTYDKHIQIDTLVRKLFPTCTTANCPAFWIGGNDNAIDQHYAWPMTGEVFSFTNWGPTEPAHPDEHCILMWRVDWKWYDLPCSHKLGFICEENRFIKAHDQDLETLKKECQMATSELEQLKKQYADRTDELEQLRKGCQNTGNAKNSFEHAIMQFNLNPKFEYAIEKSKSNLEK